MLTKITKIILLYILIIGITGCEKKDRKHKDVPKVETVTSKNAVSRDSVSGKKTAFSTNLTSKPANTTSSESKHTEEKTVQKKSVAVSKNYKIYTNLKQLLSSIGLGETKTKQQLIDSKVVPVDALQIVKSVTKVSENELEIEWKSTWLVEKVSDVKLNDDKIKVVFKNGLVYTSGNAIGIKYDGEIYHDLIIKGDRAYIPTVKKYNWKIGK